MKNELFSSFGLSQIDDKKSLNESYETNSDWRRVAVKDVVDSDGFNTEYAWYTNGQKHIFMFGDTDMIEPDEDYADWEADSEEEAQEWFSSYTGFDDDEDLEDIDFNECSELTLKNQLNESYKNFPRWLTDYFDNHRDGKAVKNRLSNQGIDLANASYTKAPFPRSNRDPVLKDPNRLTVYRLYDGRRENIYIVGVNCPKVYTPQRQWGYTDVVNLPMKDILDMAIEYGYIDLGNSENLNRDVRRERALLRSKSKEVTRGRGQYPVTRRVYDDDGDKVIGTEIEWVMTKGEDKSGYPLDPSKYARMLDAVGLDNYAARLESYYKRIEKLRLRIIDILTKYDLDTAEKSGIRGTFNDNPFDLIGDITRTFSRALSYYQRLKSDCASIVQRYESHKDSDEDEKTYPVDERISDTFKWNAKSIRDYLSEVDAELKKLENGLNKVETVQPDQVD